MPDKTLLVYPHIYKEGQILNFEQSNKGIDSNPIEFCYSISIEAKRISTLIALTNNLNQITGKILLGIFNLLSYFGISKDPSEKL